MRVFFFSSSFCEPCAQVRGVLAEASALVPALEVREFDIAQYPDEAERAGVRMTPTVVVLNSERREVFRASGVPTIHQLLVAVAKAV